MIIFLICSYSCYCDENYYITSNSNTISNIEINLNPSYIIINRVITSNIYQADTNDNIYITYIGSFASSGPHLLSSSFQRGTMIT
jgi:hypothetical protein